MQIAWLIILAITVLVFLKTFWKVFHTILAIIGAYATIYFIYNNPDYLRVVVALWSNQSS